MQLASVKPFDMEPPRLFVAEAMPNAVHTFGQTQKAHCPALDVNDGNCCACTDELVDDCSGYLGMEAHGKVM